MNLNLTKEQFKELLQLVHLGGYVRNAVREQEGEYAQKRDEALEDMLYHIGLDHEISGIKKDKDGYVGPSLDLEEQWHTIIEQYDADQFWAELERLLGQRDLERTLSNEEKQEIEAQGGWLPKRVHEIYEKYSDEFETFGIERLEINPAAPIPDIRDLL